MTQKIVSIQILRGIAASLVIVYHILQLLDGYYDLSLRAASPWLASFLQSGVDIFFVVSGFIIYTVTRRQFASGNSGRFLLHRAFRLVPLYWLLTCVYGLLLIVVPASFNSNTFDFWRLVGSMLFIPHMNNEGAIFPVLYLGWTLNFEMYFYVCFAIALNFSKQVALYLVSAILTIGVLLGQILPLPTLMAVASDPLLFEFLAGVWVAVVYFEVGQPYRQSLWHLLLGLVGLFAWLLYWGFIFQGLEEQGFPRFLTWGVPSALCFISFLMLEKQVKVLKWLIFLGDISFSLYLVHLFVLPIVAKVVAMFITIDQPALYFALGVAQYSVSVIVAAVSYRYFERPSLRLLKMLADRMGSGTTYAPGVIK